jgi:hypothetical protein
MSARKTVRIGAGAGTSGDCMLPAREFAERGAIDHLVFECLVECPVARGNLARSKNPDLGYPPSLHERLRIEVPAARADLRAPYGGLSARRHGPGAPFRATQPQRLQLRDRGRVGGGVTISLAQDIHGKSLSNSCCGRGAGARVSGAAGTE